MLTLLYLLFHISHSSFFFFFNDTATTEIYTLSLHDALPILQLLELRCELGRVADADEAAGELAVRVEEEGCRQRAVPGGRSEEHTSELQSHSDLVCRLLLEKKNNINAFSNVSCCMSS